MKQLVHPRSMDTDWVALMSRPIGFTLKGQPYSLAPDYTLDEDPFSGHKNIIDHNRHFCYVIHDLADDRDIVQDYDGFPWRGVVGSVCDGCMYAKGTNGRPFGCGRLFQESFRKSYINGRCDYWKFNLETESWFECRSRMEREKAEEHQAKTSSSYAAKLVMDFIAEHLEGKIDNLLKFDFHSLREDKKYGPIKGPTMIQNYAIVKSIIEIVFGEYWPALNVETLDSYQYQIGTIIHYQRLAGARIADRRFKALDAHCPDEELIDMAEELFSHCYTLGDFIVWPNKAIMANMFDDSKMRGYIDRMFIAMYDVMTDAKKQNMDVKAALYKNRKLMKDYQGKEGFVAFMNNFLLEEFIGIDGVPKLLFDGISNSARDFRLELLPEALRQYHDFMVPMVERRSQRILNALKTKLNL